MAKAIGSIGGGPFEPVSNTVAFVRWPTKLFNTWRTHQISWGDKAIPADILVLWTVTVMALPHFEAKVLY